MDPNWWRLAKYILKPLTKTSIPRSTWKIIAKKTKNKYFIFTILFLDKK